MHAEGIIPYRRRDHPDAVWHVTDRVNWQCWHLARDQALAVFLRAFDSATRAFDVDVLAWVVMSNHVHAVLRSPGENRFTELTSRRTKCRHNRPYPPGSPRSSVIGQCMAKLKLEVCNSIQEHLGVSGHFWEGRHNRQLITDPRGLIIRIAYDHRNPVRAGMTARAEQYERSSAAWWADGSRGPINLCRRADLPFGLALDSLRHAVAHYQESKLVDDIMEGMMRRRLRPDSEAGQQLFSQLMDKAGIHRPGAASVPHLS